MEHDLDSEGFIRGVHNYCDRWCERCRFTLQCRVYESISDEDGNLIDYTMEESLEKVGNNFSKIYKMMADWAEEQGLDINELAKLSPEDKEQERQREEFVAGADVSTITSQYIQLVDDWMKANHDDLVSYARTMQKNLEMGVDEEVALDHGLKVRDALELIRFYQISIHVKTRRAVDGLFDDCEDHNDIQTDFNGSAKVALIQIDRSLNAFEVMREIFPAKTDDWLPIMAHLQKTRNMLDEKFPNARKFVRPGFDTEEPKS